MTAGVLRPEQVEAMFDRITPVYDAQARRPLIGFTFGGVERDVGVAGASERSVDTMWQVTEATVGVIVRLFYSPEARNEVGGVVGSYETTVTGWALVSAASVCGSLPLPSSLM